MSIPKKLVEDMVVKLVEDNYFGEDKDDLIYLCHVVFKPLPRRELHQAIFRGYVEQLTSKQISFY